MGCPGTPTSGRSREGHWGRGSQRPPSRRWSLTARLGPTLPSPAFVPHLEVLSYSSELFIYLMYLFKSSPSIFFFFYLKYTPLKETLVFPH